MQNYFLHCSGYKTLLKNSLKMLNTHQTFNYLKREMLTNFNKPSANLVLSIQLFGVNVLFNVLSVNECQI